MAKKKRKSSNQDRRRREQERPESDETRAAEFVTVAWMLSTLVTLAAECLAGIGFVLIAVFTGGEEVGGLTAMLVGLLSYIALITGIVCLLLAPITHKVRKVPPPRSVTVVAAVIGAAPLAALVLLSIV